MDSDKKNPTSLEPYSFESMADIIFRSDIDQLSFPMLAAASSACAVVADHLKNRRARISVRIADKLGVRDTDGVKTSRSDSGKSLIAEMDRIQLRRTEKGGGLKYDVKALSELLERKKIEIERVIKPTSEKIDEDALETFMVKHGIPREQIYVPVDLRPDAAILEALVATGYLTQKDLESVSEIIEPQVTVTCSFDKETKENFLMALESKEGGVEEGSDSDS